MAADFVSYGKASASRPDLHGRPGINPLSLESERSLTVRPFHAAGSAWEYCRRILRAPAWRARPELEIVVSWGRKISAADREANLDSISEAAAHADIVVVSIHAHRRGKWLTQFAHHAIERGANVIFVTGPHEIRGVELYRGRPIFYSMGDCAFELEYILRLPAEAYESVGLSADASIEELRSRIGPLVELLRDRRAFEGFVSRITVANGNLTRIQLLPIDLQFDGGPDRRGRPKLAPAELGERIVAAVAAKSKKLGVRIRYDRGSNRGEVCL
jgi:poly-gamma-glutamate synthesis protein (capsule biosynthesis protein)